MPYKCYLILLLLLLEVNVLFIHLVIQPFNYYLLYIYVILPRICSYRKSTTVSLTVVPLTIQMRMQIRMFYQILYLKPRPILIFKNLALIGVTPWTECRPANQRVTGWIPSQGTCLGCRPGPQWRAYEKQPNIDVSFPIFLPPFPSL